MIKTKPIITKIDDDFLKFCNCCSIHDTNAEYLEIDLKRMTVILCQACMNELGHQSA